MLVKIKRILMQKGPLGYRNLEKEFKKMDKNSSGTLDNSDFTWGLRNYGLDFTEHVSHGPVHPLPSTRPMFMVTSAH